MEIAVPAESRATLRDGREIRVRPILPGDKERLQEFHDRLSMNTTRLRFFSPLKHLSQNFATHLTAVDFKKRCAFVVSLPGDATETIYAVGRYEGETRRSAEVAFVVEDSLQGLGIGRVLLERLVEHARSRGFTRFTAIALGENDKMLSLFRESPYHAHIHAEAELAFVRMDIRPPLVDVIQPLERVSA